MRALAVSEGVPLVDVYGAFGNDLTLIGADGLHPNAQGYAKIADTFFAAIRQTLETPPAATGTSAPWRWPVSPQTGLAPLPGVRARSASRRRPG